MPDDQRCQRTQEVLSPDPDSATGPGVAEAHEHLEHCSRCQSYFQFDTRLRARLSAIEKPAVSDVLRARIAKALDSETPQTGRSRFLRFAPLLATAAAAVLVVATLTRSDQPPEPAATPPSETGLAMNSSDPAQVSSWLTQHMAEDVMIPDIPEATLTGGSIEYLDGMRTAAIAYRMHDMPIKYYVVPATTVFNHSIDDGFYSTTMGEHRVLVFGWGQTARVLMSPMPMEEEELMEVARVCMDQEMQPPAPPAPQQV